MLAGILGLACAVPVRCEILECADRDGKVLYVNTSCPEGYTVKSTLPALGLPAAAAEEEPYICRFAEILTESEIDSALAEARNELLQAEEARDNEKLLSWRTCLAKLKRRNGELTLPLDPPKIVDEGPKACQGDKFEYRRDAIYYYNPVRDPCLASKGIQLRLRGAADCLLLYGAQDSAAPPATRRRQVGRPGL